MSIGHAYSAGSRPPRKRRTRGARRRSGPRFDTTVPTQRITRPIGSDEVRRTASEGYPLWESIEVMQLRNRRITLAYSDLSHQLADLLAGSPDAPRDANWCTFATWSSQTIGTWIDDDVIPEPLRDARGLPRFVQRWLVEAARYLVQRSNGSSYRCLAAGNRFVFLEIGLAAATFVEAFSDVDRDKPDDADWDAYWDKTRGRLADLSQLDPSWLLTDSPEPADLHLGLRQYYLALFSRDPKRRSELVLAGNLLIGAYEQRRVDGYVSASLALFTERAMRNLVRQRSGMVTGWLHRWPSTLFARLMTRGLVWNTCDEQFKVARPLAAPSSATDSTTLFPAELVTITSPLLQALLTRYDLSDGRAEGCRVRDWTSFDERMNYITNLFRSRQRHGALFNPAFPPDVEEALLDGRLLDAAETPA